MKNHSHYNYIFFQSSLLQLSEAKRTLYKKEFLTILQSLPEVTIYSYATLGLKTNTTFMLWFQSDSVEQMQNALNIILHTALGRYLTITYSYFGIKRKSNYANKSTVKEMDVQNDTRSTYLLIYPFTKTIEWHLLPYDTRKELMHEHIKTGYKYAHIRQHLIYSYGIDDYEFIVSYETEKLEEFQDLIIALRATEARRYTLNDLPIFTCLHRQYDQILELL